MDELLKGNFKVKNPVKVEEKKESMSFQEQYKKKALASIGGSMVYMERMNLTWDGDSES
ncbi:MAG: hypothetical protein JNN05_07655 [Candidatus Omnitrophica bacterium]|nr:hypothetical protein [Candidatus Omnitrophota bacterium]